MKGRIGPAPYIKDFKQILEQAKKKTEVRFEGKEGLSFSEVDLDPFCVTVKFSEKQFEELQEKAVHENRELEELVRLAVVEKYLTPSS